MEITFIGKPFAVAILIGNVGEMQLLRASPIHLQNFKMGNGCDTLRKDFVIYPLYFFLYVLFGRILDGPTILFRDLVSIFTFGSPDMETKLSFWRHL